MHERAGAYAWPAMPEDTLRWPGGWARLGPWRGHTDVAYLAVGARRPPSDEIVARCIRLLRGKGYQSVVTTELPARTTEVFGLTPDRSGRMLPAGAHSVVAVKLFNGVGSDV